MPKINDYASIQSCEPGDNFIVESATGGTRKIDSYGMGLYDLQEQISTLSVLLGLPSGNQAAMTVHNLYDWKQILIVSPETSKAEGTIEIKDPYDETVTALTIAYSPSTPVSHQKLVQITLSNKWYMTNTATSGRDAMVVISGNPYFDSEYITDSTIPDAAIHNFVAYAQPIPKNTTAPTLIEWTDEDENPIDISSYSLQRPLYIKIINA